MVNIRNKGASAEREVINIFIGSMQLVEQRLQNQGINCPAYSESIQRNALQTHKGGHDIHGLPCISVEVKRCETLAINAWWDQCTEQATRAGGLVPVLIYRQSRREWRVISWVCLTDGAQQDPTVTWLRAEYSLSDFMVWYSTLYQKFLLSMINSPSLTKRKVRRR